jgi:hypothetical protein
VFGSDEPSTPERITRGDGRSAWLLGLRGNTTVSIHTEGDAALGRLVRHPPFVVRIIDTAVDAIVPAMFFRVPTVYDEPTALHDDLQPEHPERA